MKSERRVKCDWCHDRWAPLRVTNMFIDRDHEVKVVCSQCIMATPSRELFGEEGPRPWPSRFYEKVSEIKSLRNRNDFLAYSVLIIGVIGILGVIAWM